MSEEFGVLREERVIPHMSVCDLPVNQRAVGSGVDW